MVPPTASDANIGYSFVVHRQISINQIDYQAVYFAKYDEVRVWGCVLD